MVQDSPSRKLDQYIVRFPDGMRDRLKEEAAQNNRSLNAEIIHRLEASEKMHPRASILRSLLDFQEDLLDHSTSVEIDDDLHDELKDLAERRGVSTHELLNELISKALSEIDRQTEVGKKLAASIFGTEQADD